MRPGIVSLRLAAAVVAVAAGAWPAAAQDREYHVTGTVVDGTSRALAGVTVEIRERTSRRAYKITTDAAGGFKLVGLPHGMYDATFSLPSYQTRTVEWNLREAQDRMKKVRFDPLVMLSETQVTEIKRDTRLKSELDEATGLIRKGDFDAALVVLAKMIAESPDDSNALYLTGLCRIQKGDLDGAAQALERVAQLAPDFAAARVQLAVCYERRGDKERALATYESALKLEPGNLMALYNTGVLYYNAGRSADALPYFERAVSAKPDDDRALEMAGYCQLQALRYAEALDSLQRARALATDPARQATLDEVLKELRPRVTPTPGKVAP